MNCCKQKWSNPWLLDLSLVNAAIRVYILYIHTSNQNQIKTRLGFFGGPHLMFPLKLYQDFITKQSRLKWRGSRRIAGIDTAVPPTSFTSLFKTFTFTHNSYLQHFGFSCRKSCARTNAFYWLLPEGRKNLYQWQGSTDLDQWQGSTEQTGFVQHGTMAGYRKYLCSKNPSGRPRGNVLHKL